MWLAQRVRNKTTVPRFRTNLADLPLALRREGPPQSKLGLVRALSRAPEISRLVPPVRLAFQLYPPKPPETDDIAHNALLFVVANKNNAVAPFEIRLGFHRTVSQRLVNVSRPIKFPTAPPMVNEMKEGRLETRLSGNTTGKTCNLLPKAEICVMYLSWPKSKRRTTTKGSARRRPPDEGAENPVGIGCNSLKSLDFGKINASKR